MAISKVILNGTTLMDVTQKTVTANTMLNGTTALKNDGTDITGNIASKSSSDLTVSGATVTAPAGMYTSNASASIPWASTGRPTATKGTVSNHAVAVTPSFEVTSDGYIDSGNITGTAVSVSASELVSGTLSITSSGTKDVTNYASASIPSGTEGTPTATKGAVSNHSVSVTPSVTNTGGYITGSTKTGTAVTVSASELVSGSETKTANGTYDVTNLAEVVVNVSGSGGANFGTVTMTNSSNQNTSIAFTLPSGRTPIAFFARLTTQIARSSSSRYYYVYDMRWDGSSSGGVAGNQFYMYSGTLTNVTSGYSYSQSGTTFTLSTTGSRSASPGSFYNGTYELVYVY